MIRIFISEQNFTILTLLSISVNPYWGQFDKENCMSRVIACKAYRKFTVFIFFSHFFETSKLSGDCNPALILIPLSGFHCNYNSDQLNQICPNFFASSLFVCPPCHHFNSLIWLQLRGFYCTLKNIF